MACTGIPTKVQNKAEHVGDKVGFQWQINRQGEKELDPLCRILDSSPLAFGIAPVPPLQPYLLPSLKPVLSHI
ncbi:hypothetical protein MTR_2g436550 [Medicago truncatula]|uniref:Uncharacterized protein n=1 Tax=Medicago truncatula TaxID=3880 RepID=A0A072V5Y7_MEDTR|nr:hypothetical protein MTR_2g436550 [Medicago truncatula]